MKKIIAILSLMTATLGFAADLSLDKLTAPKATDSFTYFRMGVTEAVPLDSVEVIPDVGVGHRYKVGTGAVDVSGNFTRNLKKDEGSTYFYTAPKVSYLQYITPSKGQSLYAGLGLGFGGLQDKNAAKFLGFLPCATLGWEMNRASDHPLLAQLDMSQPIWDVSDRAFVERAWFDSAASGFHPVVEFSLGAGF